MQAARCKMHDARCTMQAARCAMFDARCMMQIHDTCCMMYGIWHGAYARCDMRCALSYMIDDM
eukprot:6193139-Lingulodinium_polyedra.AAC.1